jgi:DNA/RNA endonuclease G (NUC1)
MKKFLVFYLFVFSLNLWSQSYYDIQVKTPYFFITYNEKKEQPTSAVYYVNSRDCGVKRDGLDFYTNDSIKTSDNNDYYNNVWDKGHLVPAANFRCSESGMIASFTYLNCALQHQDLNRKTWMYLENLERRIADTAESVSVHVYVIFSDKSVVLSSGATVPDQFIKEIYIGSKLYGKWVFPNKKPVSNDPKYYRVQ